MKKDSLSWLNSSASWWAWHPPLLGLWPLWQEGKNTHGETGHLVREEARETRGSRACLVIICPPENKPTHARKALIPLVDNPTTSLRPVTSPHGEARRQTSMLSCGEDKPCSNQDYHASHRETQPCILRLCGWDSRREARIPWSFSTDTLSKLQKHWKMKKKEWG